jgi:hypothetical protein
MRKNSWITLWHSLGAFGLAVVLCLVSGTGTIARAEDQPAISSDDYGNRECVAPAISAWHKVDVVYYDAIGCLADENDTVTITFWNNSRYYGPQPPFCEGELICECPEGDPLSETCFDLEWDFIWQDGFHIMSSDPACEIEYSYTYADYLIGDDGPYLPAAFDVALRIDPIQPPPDGCAQCDEADMVIREALVRIYLQPDIDITPGETTLCAPPGETVQVTFCDESTGDYDYVEWFWDGFCTGTADETSNPGECVTHSFDPPTGSDPVFYNVCVKLRMAEEMEEMPAEIACEPQEQVVTVSIYPAQDVTITTDPDPAEGCCASPAGFNVTFTPEFIGGLDPVSCVWSVDGTPLGFDCDPWLHNFDCPPEGESQTYSVQLTASYGPEGCDPATANTSVFVYGPPIIVFCDAEPEQVCAGGDVTLTSDVTEPPGIPTECRWLMDTTVIFGWGPCVSPRIYTIPGDLPEGTHRFMIQARAGDCLPVGCFDDIEVVGGPACEIIASPIVGCSPLEVTFTGEITGPHGECHWNWGDGSPPEDGCDLPKYHTYTVPPATGENFTWVVVVDPEDGSGCDPAQCSGTVRVYGQPIVEARIIPDETEFCVPCDIILVNDSQWAAPDLTTCTWYFDTTPIHFGCEEQVAHTLNGTEGPHVIRLCVETGDCAEICDEIPITIYPQAIACIDPADPQEVCVDPGDFVRLCFNSCSQNANECDWYVDGDLEQPGNCDQEFCHNFYEGDYTVKLVANAGYECCVDDEVSTTVAVRHYLTADFECIDFECIGDPPDRFIRVTFANNSTPVDDLRHCLWDWDNDGTPDVDLCGPIVTHDFHGVEPGDDIFVTLIVDGDFYEGPPPEFYDPDEYDPEDLSCQSSSETEECTIPPCECIPVYVGSGFFEPGELIRVPIKTDSDLAGCDIESFEFTVEFCDDMMEMVGTSTVGTMLGECQSEIVFWYILGPGLVRVAWAGNCDLIGPGAFVYLEFQTFEDIDCGDGCVIRIIDGALNENTDCPMCDDPAPGLWQVPWHDIAGTVTYYSCDDLDALPPPHPRPIPSATVHALGCEDEHELHAPVGPAGNYVMRGCPGCDYCLTVTKEPDTDPMSPALTSYDAALILQAVVEMIELDNCPINLPWCPPVPRPQEIVADVSDNGTVTAFDAALVLKCIVGHPEAEDALCGQWDFFCAEVCTDALNADWFVDFVGILYGDVSGNWYHGIGDNDAGQLATADIGYLHVPPVTLEPRGQLVVPLALSDAPEALSAFVNLSYDTEHMTLANISSGDMGGDCLLEFYDDGGDVRVAIACEEKFASEGTLLNLVFKVANTFGDHAADVLTVNSWMLDEQVSAQAQIDMPLALQTVTAAEDYTFALSGVRPVYEGIGGTHVEFSIPSEGRVSLKVYDLQGSRVRTLVDHSLAPGRHTAQWDWRSDAGAVVASGVYFMKLEYSGQALRSKMLVVQ